MSNIPIVWREFASEDSINTNFTIKQLPATIEEQIRIQATNSNKEVGKLYILKTVKDFARSKGLWLADMQEVYQSGRYVTYVLLSKLEMEYGIAH